MKNFLYIDIVEDKNDITFICKDIWTLHHSQKITDFLNSQLYYDCKVIIDINSIKEFDTHGILSIIRYIKILEKNRCQVSIEGMSEKFRRLYDVCQKSYSPKLKKSVHTSTLADYFFRLGEFTVKSKDTLVEFISFVGGASRYLLEILLKPHEIRFKAILYHIQTSGVNALPIIFLTSFLIGVVIAFQGAVQLEKFGANIFIVEMVTISVVRELAPLLTAIVVAGRSASSYTAQIGVMEITEEIDAMETMGFSSWNFLILPRIFGLMISLPLLVFFADCVAVFGGMVVASAQLAISFEEFMLRMQESVELKHIYIGLVKAPIFGWIIAIIGCFRGFQISSSTESVGKYTTISVVNAIFWVIAMDAIISVFLTELGL